MIATVFSPGEESNPRRLLSPPLDGWASDSLVLHAPLDRLSGMLLAGGTVVVTGSPDAAPMREHEPETWGPKGPPPAFPVLTSPGGDGRFQRHTRQPAKLESAMLGRTRDRLEKELKALEKEYRQELPKEIHRALQMGDLRENAEYQSALERQHFVKSRISQLQEQLK